MIGLVAGTLLAVAAGAAPERVTFAIRDHPQALHVYGTRGGAPAVVASGDGGWIHLGPDVAAFLAEQGYFVVGVDSKAYLASFTKGRTTLTVADVPGDFAALAAYAAQGAAAPPLLVGVSEGAALAVLAASDPAVKAKALGVVALGLPDQAELGWRFRDSIIYITKGVPKEPLFSSADVIGKVAPLPVAALHSTHDEFVDPSEVQRVMARAGSPSRLWMIEARDHRFSGATPELRRRLLEAIEWIRSQRR